MKKTIITLGWLLLCGVLSACTTATFTDVKEHSKASIELTKAFEPFLSDTLRQCRERFARQYIYSATVFDLSALEQDTKEACDIFIKPNESILAINRALAIFAEKLAALADNTLPTSLSPPLDNLSASVKSIPLPDGANATADRIDAINRLAKFLAKQTLAHEQKRQLAEALSHEDAVDTLVDTLSFYLNNIYRAQLDNQLTDITKFRPFLNNIKDSKDVGERLSARQMLAQLQHEELAINNRLATIPKFVASAEKMKASHKALRANLATTDKQEQLMQVINFVEEVRALNSALQQAF
jgi:hypothetical protein